MVKDSAFIFIKPHALSDVVVEYVKKELPARGFKVIQSGSISGEIIDKHMMVEQHFYRTANNATVIQPEDLQLPEEVFFSEFGVSWKDALARGLVCNALSACADLKINAYGLDRLWKQAAEDGRVVEFDRGLSIAEIDRRYIVNGHFLVLRESFVEPGVEVKYFVVEWNSLKLPWKAFLQDVIGSTDPSQASPESLRGHIAAAWQDFGLDDMPNVQHNVLHASASAYEAMIEKLNWLDGEVATDPFGKELLRSGVSEQTLRKWSLDPQVSVRSQSHPVRLFEALQGRNTWECLDVLHEVASQTGCIQQDSRASSLVDIVLASLAASAFMLGLQLLYGEDVHIFWAWLRVGWIVPLLSVMTKLTQKLTL